MFQTFLAFLFDIESIFLKDFGSKFPGTIIVPVIFVNNCIIYVAV